MKVTVPVGVLEPGAAAVTLAVKVTDWPKTEGFCEEPTTVAVAAVFTVCASAEEVLALKLPLPPYAAVMEWLATLSADVVKVAVPAVNVLAPNVVAPSLKVTVPIGVPDPGAVAATVAVKVTDWPNAEGLAEEATAVVVFAVFTVCVSAEEVLALKPLPPPYAAVME